MEDKDLTGENHEQPKPQNEPLSEPAQEQFVHDGTASNGDDGVDESRFRESENPTDSSEPKAMNDQNADPLQFKNRIDLNELSSAVASIKNELSKDDRFVNREYFGKWSFIDRGCSWGGQNRDRKTTGKNHAS